MTASAPTDNHNRELQFPVTYLGGRVAAAYYAVETDRARRHLPTAQLRLVEVMGKAIVAVAWFDYEHSPLGSYRELSVGLVVDRNRSLLQLAMRWSLSTLFQQYLTLGSYVLALPVTSLRARDAGLHFAGLPKTLMDLPLSWTDGRLDAAALENGRQVLSMRFPLGLGPVVPVPAMVIYSKLAGRLTMTKIRTQFGPRLDGLGRPQLAVGSDKHPLGDLVRELGLPAAPCLAIAHGHLKKADLLAPVAL